MNKSLTEHVQSIGKEFERSGYIPSKDKVLLSQLKSFELLKEEIKEMDEEKARVTSPDHPDYMFSLAQFNRVAGVNQMVRQAITLLDTIIQNLKSQIK
jgi:hypothetical protein